MLFEVRDESAMMLFKDNTSNEVKNTHRFHELYYIKLIFQSLTGVLIPVYTIQTSFVALLGA